MKLKKIVLRNYAIFLLTLPGLILLITFYYVPLGLSFVLPFKNIQYDLGIWKSPWAGLDNFRFLFNSDNAWRITRNTVVLNFLFIVSVTIISVLFAIFLNELSRKSVKRYQTIMFFPYFISWVAASYILQAILNMDHGFINSLLQSFGKEPVLWYNEPKYWYFIMVLSNAWKNIGYFTIIYYTGILGINKEYYEAAEMDGASMFSKVRFITLPLIRYLVILMGLLQLSKIFFGNFDMFYNLPMNSTALYPATDVIDTYVYRSLKEMGDIGMSSAAGLYQSVVGFIIVISANMLIRKVDRENAMF